MTDTTDKAHLRASERIKTDEPAAVLFPNGRTRIPCRVSDRSEGGVQLKISASAQLPDEFILVQEDPDHRTICRIAWRIGSRLGCEFIDEFSEDEDRTGWVMPVRAAENKGVIRSRVLKRPLMIS